MLLLTTGDIFLSEASVVVNPINCKGVMGKGLALQFAKHNPEYTEFVKGSDWKIGHLSVYSYDPDDRRILSFPTKDDWRKPSKMEYIEKGLDVFVKMYDYWEITSITFPLLGCGEGKLKPKPVLELMTEYLKPLPIAIDIIVQYREGIVPQEVI